MPRLKYESGRVEVAAPPGAERNSRITVLMEAFGVPLLQGPSNIGCVASLIKLDWHSVNAIIKRAVKCDVVGRQAEPVRHLGLDERSFASSHNDVSVRTDVDGSRVLEVTPARKLEDAQRLLGRLSVELRESLRAIAIAMNMRSVYMSATNTLLANADIVHDKFHVSKYLNDAVDQIRRAEHKRLVAQGDSPLTGTQRDITTAAAEGFNSIIQTIKADARGLRRFENFRIRILFFCGKLGLQPASVESP